MENGPIELIGRCLLDVRIGFDVAYPKRAQKLLVGRSQTLLNCLSCDNAVVMTRSSVFYFNVDFYLIVFHLFVWVFVH